MTSAQKEVHDEIVAGRRGRFGDPFHGGLLALTFQNLCSYTHASGGGLRRAVAQQRPSL
jgi:hypothetical protein